MIKLIILLMLVLATFSIAKNKPILVGIIDTQVDFNNNTLNPFFYIPKNLFKIKPDEHGTHVTGIITRGLNSEKVKIINYLFKKNSSTNELNNALITLINYNTLPDILNISISGEDINLLEHNLIKYIHSKGVIIVAASGNDYNNLKHYPCAYEEVVCVTGFSVREEEGKKFFLFSQNCAQDALCWIDFASPMSQVSTCLNNRFCKLSGSSMAAPYITNILIKYILNGIENPINKLKENTNKINNIHIVY